MADSGNMSEPDGQTHAELLQMALPVSQKVVLVIDLVESVRLMAADEAGTVARWRDFALAAQAHFIPAHRGRLVKSLGDGLMVEFEQPREAANAAHALHLAIAKGNAGLATERQFHLRAGINATHVFTDNNDIYGAGVNLAARLATLAGPGETVVSASVRDGLTDGLDASVEDLGDCYLKHIDQPVRAYRVGAAGAAPVVVARAQYDAPLKPVIAVIPFEARGNEPEYFAVGDLIADGVIAQLIRSADLSVISRLSATRFRGRGANLSEISQGLGVNYVLSGSYWLVGSAGGGKLLVSVELANTAKNQIVWTERFDADVGDLLQSESECAWRIALACHRCLVNHEVERAKAQSSATLTAYSLKLSGIDLMHRSGRDDFERGRVLLGALTERHQRSADAYAWLAKWHVLRVIRGISPSPANDARNALDACKRALDIWPDHVLTLAVQGYALCQMMGEGDLSRDCLDRSLQLAPNEGHAWLYRSAWSSHFGSSQDSVDEALNARRLSPFDPHTYFLETVLASAYAFNREYDNAMLASAKALKLDRNHAPTLRAKLLAQFEAGRLVDAAQTVSELKRLVPGFTISSYQAMGSVNSFIRQRVVAALRSMELPE